MTSTPVANQLTISACSSPRPYFEDLSVVDHGYAWLAAGMVGIEGATTFQANTKRPTRRLRRALT